MQSCSLFTGTPRDLILNTDLKTLASRLKEIPDCNLYFKLFGHRRLLKAHRLIAENEALGRCVGFLQHNLICGLRHLRNFHSATMVYMIPVPFPPADVASLVAPPLPPHSGSTLWPAWCLAP